MFERGKLEEYTSEMEHMLENIELHSNPKVLEKLKEAKRRIDEGEGIPLEEVEKKLL